MILTVQDGEEQILKSILSFLSDTFEITLVEPEQSVKVDFPGLTIFPFERKVMVEGEEVSFTLHEFDLLLFLSSHPQQVFTKKQLYEAVWEDLPIHVDAKVECIISSILKKLREYAAKEYIKTIWGVGYKFDPS